MSERGDSGTYLFVKEGKRRSEKPRETKARVIERPIDAERIRYQRPTLDPSQVDGRLVFFFEPDGEVAEMYRGVGEQLLAVRPTDRCVRLTSPRARAGRTTTALNLASALAEGHRVTVVDLDLTGPDIATAFGLSNPPCLLDMIEARQSDPRAPLDLVMISDGLALLLVANPLDADAAASVFAQPELGRILAEVAAASDLVIVDGPVALPESLASIQGLVPGTLLVVRPEAMTGADYEQTLGVLEGADVVGAVLNAAPQST